MDTGPQSPVLSPGQRARRLVPFMGVILCVVPVSFIGQTTRERHGLVLAAGGVFLLTAALVVAVPWNRLPQATKQVPVMTFCLGVALLRHSVGDGGGNGTTALLVLPVVWMAVYGHRRAVIATVAVVAVSLSIPIMVFGLPDYSALEWRRVILSTLTFLLTGLVVNQLMERVTHTHELLAMVVAARRRQTREATAPTICESLQQGADASVVSYYEHDGAGRLHLAACTDEHASSVPLIVDQLFPSDHPALATRAPAVSVLGDDDFESARSLAAAGGRLTAGLRSVVQQPVTHEGHLMGVIVAGWDTSIRGVVHELLPMLAMLAADAASATERNRLLQELERMANHDQLTGTLNRRACDQALNAEMARVDRTGVAATLVMIDLDHFKAYNDKHGHVAGDELLVEATAAWRRELRDIDVLARWGGEEFVVILPGSDVESAAAALDRMRDVTPEGQSFSAGIVAIEGRDAIPLIRAADVALYRAKATGRARNILGSTALDTAIA